MNGFVSRDTSISENTKNVAGVHVIKKGEGASDWTAHDADIHFTFVMKGAMVLEGEDRDPVLLEKGVLS